MSTTPTKRTRKTTAPPVPRPRAGARRPPAREVRAKIVRLVPKRLLEQVARAQAGHGGRGCIKCGSLFIEIEPAFVHCRYCGTMARIRGASLLAQEEYEMRSGLRLAS